MDSNPLTADHADIPDGFIRFIGVIRGRFVWIAVPAMEFLRPNVLPLP